MRVRLRWFGIMSLVALTVTLLWQASSSEVVAQGNRDDGRDGRGRHVLIHDNDAPSPQQGFDPRQGRWLFFPTNVEVARGERVVFHSPGGNDHPHTVTNLARTSAPTTLPVSFTAGNIFDSGLIQPGSTWALETGGLAVGHYPYVCRLHPWMVGEVTVR